MDNKNITSENMEELTQGEDIDFPLPLGFKIALWVFGIILVGIMIMYSMGTQFKGTFASFLEISAVIGLVILCGVGLFLASGKKPAVGLVMGVIGTIICIMASGYLTFTCDDDSMTIYYEGEKYAASRGDSFHHPDYTLYIDKGSVFKSAEARYYMKEAMDGTGSYILTDLSTQEEKTVTWNWEDEVLEPLLKDSKEK